MEWECCQPVHGELETKLTLHTAPCMNQRIRQVTPTAASDVATQYHREPSKWWPAAVSAEAVPINRFRLGSGNVFIADTENNRILELTSMGATIASAGVGPAGYGGDGLLYWRGLPGSRAPRVWRWIAGECERVGPRQRSRARTTACTRRALERGILHKRSSAWRPSPAGFRFSCSSGMTVIILGNTTKPASPFR
jgi:hypothetical protein